jgi:hypothetical protein
MQDAYQYGLRLGAPLTGTLKAPQTFHAIWASGLKPQKITRDVWGDWKIGAMVVRGSKDPNATTYSGARVFFRGCFRPGIAPCYYSLISPRIEL